MTEFKQIIGRGTRLRYDEGKTHFTIMDFRRVSRLFADPEWDGEIEQDDDYKKYLYQFFSEDTGLINVEIDFSKDIIKIREKNDIVYMDMKFKNGILQDCQYNFIEANSTLYFKTLLKDFSISKEFVEFEYDLFDAADLTSPLTRNVIQISSMKEKKIVC